MSDDSSRSSCHRRFLRAGDRQLPQRGHPPAAARRVARQPRFAVPGVRLTPCGRRQYSGGQLRAAPRPLPQCRRAICPAIRSSNWRRRRCSCCTTSSSAGRRSWPSALLLPAAMVALFAIDLEHRLLPDKITLPGIGAGLRRSLFLPPGIRDASDRASARWRVLWADRRGLLPLFRGGRAWAVAT